MPPSLIISQKNRLIMSSFRPMVVILGATSGGVATALELAKIDKQQAFEIVIVDNETHPIDHPDRQLHLFRKPTKPATPLSQIATQKNVRFIHDLVTAIHPHEQYVELHNIGHLPYDYLIIAYDEQQRKEVLPGLHEYGHSHYTRYDTARLKQALTALSKPGDKEHKVIIAGAGTTGVELALSLGQQHHYCQDCGKSQPHFEVMLVDQHSSLLSGYSQEVQQKAHALLGAANINFYPGTKVDGITADTIHYANGYSGPYDLFIWAGGLKPHPAITSSRFAFHSNGKISTNPYLQARGYSRVYGVGESAHPTHASPAQLTHQKAALDQAKIIAYNLRQQLYEQPLQQYIPQEYPRTLVLGSLVLRD
jgi:NADH dehydrogenase FAD-containing subunit